jgi:Tfp pilus assembly protein PilF
MRRIWSGIVVSAAFLSFGLAGGGQLAAEPLSGDTLGTAAEAPKQPVPQQAQQPAQPPASPEAEAVARFNKRDFDGALKVLKEAVKKDPELPPAQLIMARFFAQANVPVGVRNSLERAVIEVPDDPEPYVVMGDLALRDHRITDAQLLYLKAGEVLANFSKSAKRKQQLQSQVYSGLAAVCEARDDWPGAQKQIEAWLKFDPKSTLAMQRMARCLFQQKNAQGALEELKLAAKADPKLLTPEAVLAQYYEASGDHENAKKWMAAALVAAPSDLNTHLAAAEWDLETGQFDEGQNEAAAAMKIDPKSLAAMILRGRAAVFLKDYVAAERYFETATLQSPRNFTASNELALVLAEQKDEAKRRRALEYAENNVQQNPRSLEAASTYGWVLYKNGKIDDAEKVLQNVVASRQVSPSTPYYFAQILADRSHGDQARQLLESALNAPRPFTMRDKAKALMEQLKK